MHQYQQSTLKENSTLVRSNQPTKSIEVSSKRVLHNEDAKEYQR